MYLLCSDGWPTRVEMSGVFDQSEAALQRQVTRLRNCDPTKFRTMCHMHLTFMLDLDGSSFEDFIGEDMTDASRSKKTNFPHFGKKKTNSTTTLYLTLFHSGGARKF